MKNVRARLLFAVVLALLAPLMAAPTPPELPPVDELKLSDYLQLVVKQNETLQAQMLEAEAGRFKARGEWGIFEPAGTASVLREANKRTNNVEQQASQSGQSFFTERNTIYNGGLELFVPTGAKVQLGYTMSDLQNNVNPSPFFSSTNLVMTKQFQSFAGLSVTQPLLKNAGSAVTMANIRIAALDSAIAFQQYRRQLMLAVSQAEAAYWNLYFAQEQLSFFKESIALAESILADSREKLKAGQASELDVLEAQSSLALRQTKQNEARQNFYDAIGQLQSFSGVRPRAGAGFFHAADIPPAVGPALAYAETFQQAFEANPDYLIQRQKVEESKLRLGVARNQLLPELNLKGGYGYNGLGRTPDASMDTLETRGFPSWSLGLELRIPLGGGIKGQNDFSAAKVSLQESIANLNAMQTQIANALDTSIHKTQGWEESIQSYQTVVEFNESLLKTQIARLNAGKVEPRKVFEVEADLFESRQSLAQARVARQRTLLELELAEGTILKTRNLDLTREQLRQSTRELLANHALSLENSRPVLLPPVSAAK